MADVVVDCSVAVKWFVPEDHSDLAFALLNSEQNLHAPGLLVSEFANTMWKLARRDLIQVDDALRMAAEISTIQLMLYPPDELAAPALTMALAAGHPAYDCFYLALALQLDGLCVTADRRFYDAFAESYPDTMIWIEDVAEPDAD